MALTRRRFSQSAEALAGCPKTTSKPVHFRIKQSLCQYLENSYFLFQGSEELRTYPKRDFGLYLIDSHAGVETLISGGFEHQGLLFNYRLLRLLR
ncbi:hypothetical protein CYD30_27875 [Kosakonia cowanii]|nr:hypothetical protein CYD30_27875 [Kosakonia cowanii]